MSQDATESEREPALGGLPEPSEATPSIDFPVVGIGSSAGGIEALSALLKALPPDPGLALVVIQHLSPTHASVLAEILARQTALPVTEISDGTRVERNHVYVIPANAEASIEGGRLRLKTRPKGPAPPRSIDIFFRSLAGDLGHNAIGVLLSGSDADGTLGMQAIKAGGGITFAQDASAQHDTMPRSAVAAGAVDSELPPALIGPELARIARHFNRASAGKTEPSRAVELAPILELLRAGTDVDFSNYKRNTLARRIGRRAVLHKCESLAEYTKYLKGNASELAALFEDILISVTSFFRNPEAFEALKAHVFPRLTQDRTRSDAVRIWVQGCSTGEEAYSLAIAFIEYCESAGRSIPMQVFATDLNGVGIERARLGLYGKAIATDVSPERLRRFFVEVDGTYRIAKSIRDRCVFAKHNVLTAPPFSNIDLVSCRNLLIYLEPALQQRLLPVLHYALKPGGFLWLGSSETIGPFRELFELDDPKHKIYSRKAGSARSVSPTFVAGLPVSPLPRPVARPGGDAPAVALDVQKEADRVLLSRFSPPSVLIDSNFEIQQFRGDTAPYLAPSPGKASLNVLKMLREGLVVGVRAAIERARKEGSAVREQDLRVRMDGTSHRVNIEVVPVRAAAGRDASFLVLFEPADREGRRRAPRQEKPPEPPPPVEKDAAQREVLRLNQELTATRSYLQSVIEQQEAANEELQSANEEVQSSNEELQSINEELETSKEEIQSSNEELATVNDELHNRNLELTQSNNDLVNLLASVQMAIVMLGGGLQIRRFTPLAARMLKLIPADVGCSIGDIKLNLDVPDLEQLLAQCIDTVSPRELDVRDKDGHWFSLRIRPYKTLDNTIDGCVLVLVDIDDLKRTEATLLRQQHLMEQAHEPILMWEFESGTVIYWNKAAEDVYGFPREEAISHSATRLLSPDGPGAAGFRKALQESGSWTGEIVHRRRDGQPIDVESRMALVRDASGKAVVIETNLPISPRKKMEQALHQREAQDRHRNEFLAMLAHELRNPLAPLRNAIEVLKSPVATAETEAAARAVMDRQLSKMASLIDDLLDVARITRGDIQFKLETVDAVDILRGAVEPARIKARVRRQHLTAMLPERQGWVYGDALRLEQVFDNLLDNATKFTPAGGNIRVSAELHRPPPVPGTPTRDELIVSVRDDGMGLEAKDIERVFELFVQGDTSLDRSRGGLGIGLTLSRRLVEQHGGTLTASSPGRDQGSEFVVRLPLSAPPTGSGTAPGAALASRAPEAPSPRRILVVDDSIDAADTLAAVLRIRGHTVEVCNDSTAVMALLDRFRPDIAILDIGMPNIDGFRLAMEVRRRADSRDLALFAFTGYGRDDDRRRGQDAGFDEYITKPCDTAALFALIARYPARPPQD